MKILGTKIQKHYSKTNILGDDQRSLLSDSWSTDVVASDNEGPGPQLPLPMGENLAPGVHRPAGRPNIGRYRTIFAL